MVNVKTQQENPLSTKSRLLAALRENAGKPVSGGKLAQNLGVSRVAVWKTVQSLAAAGYPLGAGDAGYSLNSGAANDFLYAWEFGDKEPVIRYFENAGSTMDNMRELAAQGCAAGTVALAEKQTAGKGRYGRTWSSRQGGLYFTVLERPSLTLADYCLPLMRYQIAAARAITAICGKPARLRWPNDIYIDRRKVAGLLADIAGEGDLIKWVSMGIGVNVNNQVPTARSVSCADIAGRRVSRRDLLLMIINEAEKAAALTGSAAAYSQGNRLLAAEWNSMADGIGAKAAVLASGLADTDGKADEGDGRLLARGIFAGIDPAGRCIIKSGNGKETLYFNPGPVSLIF